MTEFKDMRVIHLCQFYSLCWRRTLCWWGTAGPGGGPGEERGQAATGLAEAGQGLHISWRFREHLRTKHKCHPKDPPQLSVYGFVSVSAHEMWNLNSPPLNIKSAKTTFPSHLLDFLCLELTSACSTLQTVFTPSKDQVTPLPPP